MIPRYFLFFSLICGQLLAQYTPGGGGSGSVGQLDILTPEKAVYGGVPAYTKGKAISMVSAASVTLLNYTGSGYVSNQWFAIGSLGSGHSGDLVLTLVVDGRTVYNASLSAYMGAIYWTDDVLANFQNRWIMLGGGQSGMNRIPVPFASSVSISLKNNSSGTITLWYEVGYVTGVADNWLRSKQLYIAVSDETAQGIPLTQDQVGTLVNVSAQNPGMLAGVYMVYDGAGVTGGAPNYLEGAVDITTDGTLSYRSSGTEDYYGMSGFWANVSVGWGNPDITLTLKRGSPSLYAAMRFHAPDPILFQNALKVQWHAGDSSISTFTGTVHLLYTVWYYTQ